MGKGQMRDAMPPISPNRAGSFSRLALERPIRVPMF